MSKRESHNPQRNTTNIQMLLKPKNNNNSYPTNQNLFENLTFGRARATEWARRRTAAIGSEWETGTEWERDGARKKAHTRIEYNIIYIIAVIVAALNNITMMMV